MVQRLSVSATFNSGALIAAGFKQAELEMTRMEPLVKAVLKSWGDIIVNDLRTVTPIDTGALRRSLRWELRNRSGGGNLRIISDGRIVNQKGPHLVEEYNFKYLIFPGSNPAAAVGTRQFPVVDVEAFLAQYIPLIQLDIVRDINIAVRRSLSAVATTTGL